MKLMDDCLPSRTDSHVKPQKIIASSLANLLNIITINYNHYNNNNNNKRNYNKHHR